MRITPTLILSILGGFAIVTGLVALGQGAGDWWLWLLAGLLAEAGAVAIPWARRVCASERVRKADAELLERHRREGVPFRTPEQTERMRREITEAFGDKTTEELTDMLRQLDDYEFARAMCMARVCDAIIRQTAPDARRGSNPDAR